MYLHLHLHLYIYHSKISLIDLKKHSSKKCYLRRLSNANNAVYISICVGGAPCWKACKLSGTT